MARKRTAHGRAAQLGQTTVWEATPSNEVRRYRRTLERRSSAVKTAPSRPQAQKNWPAGGGSGAHAQL